MVDKLHEHEDNIQRITKHSNDEAKKLFHVENIVYDKGEKLDVFEQIHQRIAEVVTERREVEIELKASNTKIMDNFDVFNFRMQNHEKELKTVIEQSKMISDANSELKDIMRQQNDSFTHSINEMSNENIKDHQKMRERISSLELFNDNLNVEQGN